MAGPPKKTAVRISVGFDDVAAAELAELARANDCTIAWIVRRAVADFIAAQSQQQLKIRARSPGRAEASHS